MTLIAVPIFVRDPDDVAEAIARAKDAVDQGADLIEWRIDSIGTDEAAAAAVHRLLKHSPAPCIMTLRSEREGGEYDGGGRERGAILSSIAHAEDPPRYIDLEFAHYAEDADIWPTTLDLTIDHEPPNLILSVHDFSTRPVNLIQLVDAMSHEAHCNVVKVAWFARSIRDNLEAFDLIRERRKPMIALCMGPFGLMSRVLAPKFGGFITFASLEPGGETAPGQPTISQLKKRYRFDAVGEGTGVYGVIGWPVEHSLGPHIHNAGFGRVQFDGVYVPMPVPPEYEHFKASVGAMIDHPGLHFRGASVTLPHKEHLLRFIDERGGRIDDCARLAGAANTLLVGATGAIVGRNTDAPAVVDVLSNALNCQPSELADRRIAVLGAGGVARAALSGLVKHNAGATVFNRTKDRAELLVADLNTRAAEIDSTARLDVGEPDALQSGAFDVVINCTSIGMEGGPLPDESPLDVLSRGTFTIDETLTLFDTVYTPWRTAMIAEAESRGARVILGVDMFLRQAELQFESWTGERAPVDHWRDMLQEIHETAEA